jgi:chromosome segregation ATPase
VCAVPGRIVHGGDNMPLTASDLNAIEAQLDSTVPYYVPTLIAELRSQAAELTRLQGEVERLDGQVGVLLKSGNAILARAEAAEREVARLKDECGDLRAVVHEKQDKAITLDDSLRAEQEKARRLREWHEISACEARMAAASAGLSSGSQSAAERLRDEARWHDESMGQMDALGFAPATLQEPK